ncbi:MAG: hypothetical protein RIQ60_858 [Pseudomonadota bacterium]|jgi:uncharacterized protein (UPF0276 family)
MPPGLELPRQAARAGIGWRHPHYRALLEQRPELGFIEVHSENFFADGGAALALLAQAREHYELSLHGVGLSLGSAWPLDEWHLQRLQRLVGRMQPWLVSEHAAYARGQPLATGKPAAGRSSMLMHANDLLPLPFSRAALHALVEHVDQVQTLLGRRIAVENISAYLVPPGGEELTEPEVEATFLRELAERSGCRLLVDVNNLVVNALNAQRRGLALEVQTHCERWLDVIDPRSVAEIHLAGHDPRGPLIIDDHGCAVPDRVWAVHAAALRRFGQVPTLVEWDNHLPPFEVLLQQARQADAVRDELDGWPSSPGARPDPLDKVQVPVRSASGASPSVTVAATAAATGVHTQAAVPASEAQCQALAHDQSRLLGWLMDGGPSAPAAEAPAGLAIYLNNAEGLARRCLSAAYPVLRELIGAEGFDAMAGVYRRADPPRHGDLADWGSGLADWLAAAADLLSDAPYLPDMARLEWALHCAELAADGAHPPPLVGRDAGPDGAAPDVARKGTMAAVSLVGVTVLERLADTEPATLQLGLAAATQVWSSPYPVVAIWQAHQAAAVDDGAQAAAARCGLLPGALDGGAALPAPVDVMAAALSDRSARLAQVAAIWAQERRPCLALIWRPRWRVQVREIDPASAAFVNAILAGGDLATALDVGLAVEPPLDFGRWLAQALADGLLREVRPL